MRKLRLSLLGLGAALIVCVGCTLNVPGLPTGPINDIQDFFEGLERQVENAIEDPLGNRPYPVLLGGNTQRLFYATNLGDTRINFPGRTNDIVLPGLLGPSNLYELADKERELVRPLIPAGALVALRTDGATVAFLTVTRLETPIQLQLLAAPVDLASAAFDTQVLWDSDTADAGATIAPYLLAVSDRRAAFVTTDTTGDFREDRLRIVDLTGLAPDVEISGASFEGVALERDRLVTVETDDAAGAYVVTLRNLTDDLATVLAELRATNFQSPNAFITNNTVVWDEVDAAGNARVLQYDIPSATTTVWADAVVGRLTGARDDFFVTEDFIEVRPTTERIAVWRYNSDGVGKKLAEFRGDGLAGQATIIGDDAVWVNPERRIVLQPLAGGDRKIFRAF